MSKKDMSKQYRRDELTSYKNFILEIFAAGGLPLVLVALGGFLIVGDNSDNTMISLFILSGSVLWIVNVLIVYFKWKIRINTLKSYDISIIDTVCKILEKEDAANSTLKIKEFMQQLDNLNLVNNEKNEEDK